MFLIGLRVSCCDHECAAAATRTAASVRRSGLLAEQLGQLNLTVAAKQPKMLDADRIGEFLLRRGGRPDGQGNVQRTACFAATVDQRPATARPSHLTGYSYPNPDAAFVLFSWHSAGSTRPGNVLNMMGRQLIHSQSAPERERPDAAPLAAGLHVAKSSSGRLERGQSVANSDGAKVPPPTPHPPKPGFEAVSGAVRRSRRTGPSAGGRRFPGLNSEMAAEAGHCHQTSRGTVRVSPPHEGHAPFARGPTATTARYSFWVFTMGQWLLTGAVTDNLWGLRSALLPRMPSQPSISTRGLSQPRLGHMACNG